MPIINPQAADMEAMSLARARDAAAWAALAHLTCHPREAETGAKTHRLRSDIVPGRWARDFVSSYSRGPNQTSTIRLHQAA